MNRQDAKDAKGSPDPGLFSGNALPVPVPPVLESCFWRSLRSWRFKLGDWLQFEDSSRSPFLENFVDLAFNHAARVGAIKPSRQQRIIVCLLVANVGDDGQPDGVFVQRLG